ncbi:MAG: carboxypeptidase regulatory-like domain-containing protein [Bacteroidetes bacterium]|nr:MAG: carboxypeptidase regulatory-like domain-containing protein [Bacteroidota bacterium]
MRTIFTTNGYRIVCYLLLTPVPFFCLSQQTYDDVSRSSSSYSGTVFEKATQKPIVGARITITNTENDTKVATVSSGRDGIYYFSMQTFSNIKVQVTMSDFKKGERSFTKNDLKEYGKRLPTIYLDTAFKIDFTPAAPVRQSKEDFVVNKLESVNLLPLPAAYDLLFYLNPGLRGKDSLMSNDKVILPKMPRISNDVKRQNKDVFLSDRTKDKNTQNQLHDSIDKLIRILSDDISKYKIKYDGVDAGGLRQLREYMQMDLQDYKSHISKTSKLKAEEIIQLINSIAVAQETMLALRRIGSKEYEQLKALWEDLSYLLLSSRYMLFSKLENTESPETTTRLINNMKQNSGPANYEEGISFVMPIISEAAGKNAGPDFDQDEVGVFGFLIWSETMISKNKPDLADPSKRYLVRYFPPALKGNTKTYKLCSGPANVAIGNLTRARYGIEIYDTWDKKYVEPLYDTFETSEAFTNPAYSNFLISDFKDIKYILIKLK